MVQTFKYISFALMMVVVTAITARADTYILLMNTLDEPVSINGSDTIESKGGIWSPLDASILYDRSKRAKVIDEHTRCDGGWKITGQAEKSETLCLPLGFGEIGCVLAVLSKDETDSKHKIELEKLRGTACSDQWWNTKGKAIFEDAYTKWKEVTAQSQDGAKAAAEFISAIE